MKLHCMYVIVCIKKSNTVFTICIMVYGAMRICRIFQNIVV